MSIGWVDRARHGHRVGRPGTSWASGGWTGHVMGIGWVDRARHGHRVGGPGTSWASGGYCGKGTGNNLYYPPERRIGESGSSG